MGWPAKFQNKGTSMSVDNTIVHAILTQSDFTADGYVRDFAAQCVFRVFCFLLSAQLVSSLPILGNYAWLLLLVSADCNIRYYMGALISDAQIVTVWLINWLKLRAMFNRDPLVKWSTAVICILAISTQFQYLWSSAIGVDSLGRCMIPKGGLGEYIHTGGDLAIRVVLSGLFVAANLRYTSALRDSTAKDKLMSLVLADSRATFIDTIALAIKFSVLSSDIPPAQTRFIFHFMDFAKCLGTHWFVMEVTTGVLTRGHESMAATTAQSSSKAQNSYSTT
ncbi:hypothetical protein HK096_005392 [Nowakowskiella sp. JEL0078]|nr:hypothetical protein HK096_005392 [Nowakowskiella sp. JEL0078]